MQYHGENTIYMCLVKQENPVSLMAFCVLYRRDPFSPFVPGLGGFAHLGEALQNA